MGSELAFSFQSSGRSRAALVTLLVLGLLLAAAWHWLEASPWVLGIVGVFALPAVMDVLVNRSAGLSLDGAALTWHSGRRTAEIPLNKIRGARFDTRLDFSVRVTLLLVSGQRLRIPFEATPPHEDFEAELTRRDIPVERHHFSLLG